MKESEMTNEMLADELEKPLVRNRIVIEAAARLRLKQQSDNYATAMCRQEAECKREICDLRRRLKVAEDSLEKITTGCFSHKDGDKPIVQVIIDIASNALFTIRDEGGET